MDAIDDIIKRNIERYEDEKPSTGFTDEVMKGVHIAQASTIKTKNRKVLVRTTAIGLSVISVFAFCLWQSGFTDEFISNAILIIQKTVRHSDWMGYGLILVLIHGIIVRLAIMLPLLLKKRILM